MEEVIPKRSNGEIWAHDNHMGGPSVLTFRYSSSGSTPNLVLRVNGSDYKTANRTGALVSKPSYDVTIGGQHSRTPAYGNWNGYVSEFLIFNEDISKTNRDKLEGLLVLHKWSTTAKLPSDHTYKTNAPNFGGWSVGRASSGNDAIALKMENAGGEYSTNVPINDNEWHHLTTTYGSGNKKIYVDGGSIHRLSDANRSGFGLQNDDRRSRRIPWGVGTTQNRRCSLLPGRTNCS